MPDSSTSCHGASKQYTQARLDHIQQTVAARLDTAVQKLARLK